VYNHKTAALNIRISQPLKDALCEACKREHRSMVNMIEILIREYCEINDISIQEGADIPKE
jgi:hypothetical protein